MESSITKLRVLFMLGSSGAGKTTFIRTLFSRVFIENPYIINLNPSCKELSYTADVDIRHTVNYDQLIKEFELGNNGTTLLALNMFGRNQQTKLGELLRQAGAAGYKWCLIDTPGHMDLMHWSAMYGIIGELRNNNFAVVIMYMLDAARVQSADSFLSNMVNICAQLAKLQFRYVILLNKIDVRPCDFITAWMKNFYKKQRQLFDLDPNSVAAADTLSENLPMCGVSATTAAGCEKLMQLLSKIYAEQRGIQTATH